MPGIYCKWPRRAGHRRQQNNKNRSDLDPRRPQPASSWPPKWSTPPTEAPIEGAFVVVLNPEVEVSTLRTTALSEVALTWGQTNERGEFTLASVLQRGQSYGVAVLAKGYRPLAADDALQIDESAPDLYDPWNEIRLLRE